MSDHELSPSAEYRFFIYDPQGNGFQYYASVEARDAARDGVIQSYLDDGWDEEVEYIVAGEVTHTCQQVGREERPGASELDAERCDRDGKYWGDWQYTCNYDLLPLEPDAVVDPPVMAGARLDSLEARIAGLDPATTSALSNAEAAELIAAVRTLQVRSWLAAHDGR